MEKIKVIIADDSAETRENVETMLGFNKRMEVIGEASNGGEAIFLTREARPDVILMDINMPIIDGIKAAEEISLSVPDTIIIMISVQREQEYIKKAMAAGARDFIDKPFNCDELTDVIIKAVDLDRKRKERISGVKKPEEISGKIVTVFSTKGGVGKTTIATNIAVGLARLTKKKIALVDLDLQFGDSSIMLNLTVKNTVSDLVREINQLDSDLMEEYLITHFSGVKVLPAPIKPEYAEYITAKHVEKILNTLRNNYHYIIIDTSASFSETVLTALDMSDTIMLVSTLDLPTIKNVKTGLDLMVSLKYPAEKIKVILNKASEQFGIKYKDFENTVQHKVWSYIPEDSQTVITSANKGFPFVMTRMDTKVAKAIMDICATLSGGKEEKEVVKLKTRKLFG